LLIEGFEIDLDKLPGHIGIIMDGNGRWAKSRKLPRIEGHRRGVASLRRLLNFAYDVLHLDIISVYAFSIENWKRSKSEVNNLMKLFGFFYKNEFKEIKKRKVRLVHSGEKEGLSEKVLKMLNEMEEETKDFDKGTINLVFNYGGRQEIINGIKRVLSDLEKGVLKSESLDEKSFKNYLYQPLLPDPDLVIRTSGELRISNFLLWEIAYSELYFSDKNWPDFEPKDLTKAIYEYQKRERRFGGV
jgi:undecaprenyl diphosphate synthase